MTTLNAGNVQQIGQLSAHQPLVDSNGVLTRQGYLFLNALATQAVSALSTSTSAASGSATALPSTPAGYLSIPINGTVLKIPYYN